MLVFFSDDRISNGCNFSFFLHETALAHVIKIRVEMGLLSETFDATLTESPAVPLEECMCSRNTF